jgi:hypothetical protein
VNLGFSSSFPPLFSVVGSPFPVLNIPICQVFCYTTNLCSFGCPARLWPQNLANSGRASSFLMTCPIYLILATCIMRAALYLTKTVSNSCAACISHTISHGVTQPSIHLRIMQDIRAIRVNFEAKESWSVFSM